MWSLQIGGLSIKVVDKGGLTVYDYDDDDDYYYYYESISNTSDLTKSP